MDFSPFQAAILLAIAATWLISFRRRKRLPPGPTPLPIIGNMLQVGSQPHETFAELSKQYGSLMSIHLGSLYTVVVSSPEMAKEILQLFNGRENPQATEAHDYRHNSVGLLPMGDTWREMRKISMEHIFSKQSMERSLDLRKEKLRQLLDHAQKCSEEGRAVDFSEATFVTTTNAMSEIMFSEQDVEFDSPASTQVKEMMHSAVTIASVPNYADYFPMLRPFDLQGVKRRARVYYGRMLGIMEGRLDERIQFRKENPNAPKKNDLLEMIVDSLLAKDNKLTRKSYTHLLMDMYIGTLVVNTNGIEWMMKELVSHPDKMAKLKAELKSVMGDEKVVDDSKMSKLPYLQAVVKESMRLHPPSIVLNRQAESDQVVNGYLIPKGTRVLINLWGMGRDSTIWDNPLSFEPERFLDQKIDFKGQDYELIPFGSGKRICPGMSFSSWVMHTMPATLIHNFNWKLERQDASDKEAKRTLNGFPMGLAAPLKILPYKE
ncbi:sugiol synthase-like [Salvia hispanica]|uniref:sugiol synthase-like n=1 Tax=Salvia hispanica TaxID=49212 RepID=UPI00200932B8|nr:sugiol synthase-like [Salvia hispanica]